MYLYKLFLCSRIELARKVLSSVVNEAISLCLGEEEVEENNNAEKSEDENDSEGEKEEDDMEDDMEVDEQKKDKIKVVRNCIFHHIDFQVV